MVHELKIWPAFFDHIANGSKKFEVRKNDRKFEVGDQLLLSEYEPVSKSYTGRHAYCSVTYVMQGGQFGIQAGHVVMAVEPLVVC